MSNPIVDSVQTDVPCPGRDCNRQLLKVVRSAAGGAKTYEDWTCAASEQHVTQQWEAPAEYGTV